MGSAPHPKPPGSAAAAIPVPVSSKPVPPKKTAAKPKTVKPPKISTKFRGSIYPPTPLPDVFVKAVRAVEKILKGPAWLIVQDGPPPSKLGNSVPFHSMDGHLLRAFLGSAKSSLPENKPINIILESPGGQAGVAYELAVLFRTRCAGFDVYVPEFCKSAATLLALGASNIWLAKHAELGPLDVQVFDAEREGFSSALDEVQSLERLNAFALQAVDAGMLFLANRTGKPIGILLPHVLHFVSEMLRPMFEKLDTVHYTQMSRILKVGEEYAIRLLEPRYGKQRAEEISRQLVNGYPEHGFFIDRQEASRIGLKTAVPSDELAHALERVREAMHGVVAIGELKAL